ncbi:hypothetical protein VNI00_010007 [Paramarasmius palmivorus]|uniref:Uncharacterized protein n=1 Tax=Paramarasmius palmivorus TaxID=297713 RepID=A0AAW0CMN4_9AGAR
MNLNYDLADPTQTLPYIVMTEEQLAGSRNLAGLEFGDMLVDPDSWSKSALPACQQNYLQPQSPILWDADSNATPSPASSHFPSPSLYDSVPGDFAEFDFLNALPEYQNFPIPSDFAWQESPHVPGAYFPGICQNPVYPTSSSDPGSYLGFMDSSVLSLSPAFEDTYSSMIMEPLPTTSSVLFAPIPIMGAPYYGTTSAAIECQRRDLTHSHPRISTTTKAFSEEYLTYKAKKSKRSQVEDTLRPSHLPILFLSK